MICLLVYYMGKGTKNQWHKQGKREVLPKKIKASHHHTIINIIIMTKQEFLLRYLDEAVKAGRKYRIDTTVILAQAAIESGWGESTLAREHRNLFGLTGYGPKNDYWHGCKVELKEGGLCFRKYAATADSFFDFARLIRSAYPRAAEMSHDPAAYAFEIAYSQYISEVNGDNRAAYRKMLVSICGSINKLMDINSNKHLLLWERSN